VWPSLFIFDPYIGITKRNKIPETAFSLFYFLGTGTQFQVLRDTFTQGTYYQKEEENVHQLFIMFQLNHII